MYLEEMITFTTIFNKNPSWKMDILLWSGFLLAFCEVVVAAKLSETYEKFYTTDVSNTAATAQHSAMGISTLAKFSMLSNTPTLFKVRRPGLNNAVNTVSFQSLQKPGFFLRHKDYKFHMEKDDGTDLFQKDATFHEKLGPRGRAYELLGGQNWYICHTDTTPYTLMALNKKIGTQDFVNNCVYVPMKQDLVEKKNIVKTSSTGGAMIVNHVPTTQETDKCISIRFVNNLGGPVRVVSSLKPEGYLVTANAFKLKTIFKHANHKQRHVIFYAENVQDRDDDVMLNKKNVFTIKPHECVEDFKNVILSSQSNDAKSDGATTKSEETHTTPIPHNDLTPAIPTALGNGTPTPPTLNDGALKPPGISGISVNPTGLPDTSKTQGITPAPIVPKTTPSILQDAATPNPIPSVSGIGTSPSNDPATPKPYLSQQATVTASEIGVANTPKPYLSQQATVTASEIGVTNTPKPYLSQQATVTASEIGVANTPKPIPAAAWATANPKQLQQPSYTAPLKRKIENLNNVLQKRIETQSRPVLGSVAINPVSQNNDYSPTTDGYQPWSSYGPCSVSCGIGTRRRTRICRPGFYCVGPAAQTRACIKGQCASNCIRTTGGTVREGSCCHFPFSYDGGQYYHCIVTPKNNERMWCATTPYFEQDRQWGYCPRSTKGPTRSFVKPVTSSDRQSSLSSYNSNNNEYYSPYMTEDDYSRPCNAMCSRMCDATCPKHCCQSVRADLPITAYMGNNYDRNDKRSNLYPYQQRYQ